MSPTEDQLRAALNDGAGDGLDPDAVIGRAEAYRRQRRARILVTSATAVVVAAAGVGVGIAATSADSQRNPTAAAGSSATAVSGQGAGQAYGPAAPAPRVAPVAACPATRPALGDVGTTNGKVFSSAVTAVTVCGYRYNGSQIPASQTYSGADAQTIAASLELASRDRQLLHCDVVVASRVYWLTFFAQYANGARARVVIAGVGCNGTVNNGATMRYEWTPPGVLSSLLDKMDASVPLPASS